MRLPRWISAVLSAVGAAFGLSGCGTNLLYQDTYTPGGNVNFHVFSAPTPTEPGIYRVGLPPTPAAWAELRHLVEEPGRKVTKVVLHDQAEGDESPAVAFGWNVVLIPLVPEGDRPLTVLEKPNPVDVHRAVQTVLDAHARGDVVVFGCQHDRERGGLIAGLLGISMFKWTAQYAFDYQVKTGSRIEVTPGLLSYWIELVNHWRI